MTAPLTIDDLRRWTGEWYDLRTRADTVRALLTTAARGPLTASQAYQLQVELEAIRAVACDPVLDVLFLPPNEFREEDARR
jgi:hypothetical protein